MPDPPSRKQADQAAGQDSPGNGEEKLEPLQILPGVLHSIIEQQRRRTDEDPDTGADPNRTCRAPALCQLLDDVGEVSFEMAGAAALCFEESSCE
jgi:hypothetical protein